MRVCRNGLRPVCKASTKRPRSVHETSTKHPRNALLLSLRERRREKRIGQRSRSRTRWNRWQSQMVQSRRRRYRSRRGQQRRGTAGRRWTRRLRAACDREKSVRHVGGGKENKREIW
eukprot:5591473-Pleurochrysis_carterae.AAC.1